MSPRTSRNNPPSSRTGNERNQNRDSRRDFRERDRDRGRGEDYDRAWYPRGRDDYRPQRRERSRSPPPMRYRSRSRSVDQEELNIPRRAPSDVPEVQIIVKDEVDRSVTICFDWSIRTDITNRNFLYFVEKAFRDRMVRVDVLFLEPRITLDAVIRRQILEGVQAVVTISRQMQLDGRIQLQVFNRQAGNANVRFDGTYFYSSIALNLSSPN